MKLLGGLLGLLIVAAVGGVIFLGMSDIHIEQTTVTKSVEIKDSQN